MVSVNPYRTLPIYDAEMIERYKGRNLYELPPHMLASSWFNQIACITVLVETNEMKCMALIQFVFDSRVVFICGRTFCYDKGINHF